MKSTDVPLFGCIDTIYESDIDDDNYSGAETSDLRERRRKSHTEAEQRRRNALKRGFENLRELFYPAKDSASSVRLSKLLLLNKSISEVKKLVKEVTQRESDVSALERTVETLRFTAAFYGNQVQQASSNYAPVVEPLGEDPKLKIFELLADNLFTSFDSSVNTSSFQQFAESFLNWLEEICAHEVLYKILESILPNVLSIDSADSQDLGEGCRSGAMLSARCTTSTDFAHPQEPFVSSSEPIWTDPASGVPPNESLYPAIPPHFSSVRHLQSSQNPPSETGYLSTPPASLLRETILATGPQGTTRFSPKKICDPTSVSLEAATQDSESTKPNSATSYTTAIFANPCDKRPTPMALSESVFESQNHPTLFKQFR